ncbi:MAG: hypothetical protein ABEJ31_05825 [Haloarculaceae archaeon]
MSTCTYCGQPIETREWHPVTTATDSDGAVTFYAFCSADCQREWRVEALDPC